MKETEVLEIAEKIKQDLIKLNINNDTRLLQLPDYFVYNWLKKNRTISIDVIDKIHTKKYLNQLLYGL